MAEARTFPRHGREIPNFIEAKLLGRISELDTDRVFFVSLKGATRSVVISTTGKPQQIGSGRATFASSQALQITSAVLRTRLLEKSAADPHAVLPFPVVSTESPDEDNDAPLTIATGLGAAVSIGAWTMEDNDAPLTIATGLGAAVSTGAWTMEDNDAPLTIATGLAAAVSTGASTMKEATHTPWPWATGVALSGLTWAYGGLNAQIAAAAFLVAIYCVLKAIEELRKRKLQQAFFQLLQFPIWMALPAIGNAADIGWQREGIKSAVLLVVISVCFLGSLRSIAKLLGQTRVEEFIRSMRSAIQKLVAE